MGNDNRRIPMEKAIIFLVLIDVRFNVSVLSAGMNSVCLYTESRNCPDEKA